MKSACLLFFSAAAAFAQDPAAAAKAYLETEFKANHFSGSALVVREGKVILRAAYGPANAEHNIANTPETRFRIGSITKQFTATAIMQLRERGKLKLEDTLDKYFTPCPEPWKKVSVHHLLTHTSGIPSYTSDAELMKKMALNLPLDGLIATFRDKALEFEPGSKFVYNNSGYALLGATIEKVSGLSYEEYLRLNIFEPAGMKNTGYDRFENVIPNRASGYVREGGTLKHAPYMSMSLPFSAGALYSTVDDLRLWDEALATDKLLPRAALEKMYTPVLNKCGYGWFVEPKDGRRSIYHQGGINGFNSTIVRFPAEKTLVVALSNLGTPHMARIGSDLAAIAFGGKPGPKERTETKIDPKLYDSYAGQYQLAPGFRISITREGSPGDAKLMAQATGQGKAQLFAESETKFFYKVTDAQITFEKDKLTLHQNGRDMPAPRVSLEPGIFEPLRERVAIAADPKVLAAYAGVYELMPGFSITVKLEGGKLMAQATGQSAFEIFPESETEFFYKVVDASITFSKDKLVLHQGGRDLPGKRVE